MPRHKYYTIDELLEFIYGHNRWACKKILEENRELFERAPGSSHNHQAWPGGYMDHVVEVMNIAIVLYGTLNGLRFMQFALSDALTVLFLHDLEKPWKYKFDENGELKDKGLTKEERKQFRDQKLKEYGVRLSPEQRNGMKYVEGELDDYSSKKRVQGPLAAFCHMCDVASARIYYKDPRERGVWMPDTYL